jgi:hypothetical protein
VEHQREPARVLPTYRTVKRTLTIIGASLAVLATGACGLQSVTDEEAAEVAFTERTLGEAGDIERDLGETGTVYEREATLIGFEMVEEFNEIDNEGYVVLEVAVRNVGSGELDRNRGDWTLELPDGRRVQTAPVEGQPQLTTGTLEEDEEITAKVVFAVGDQRGTAYAVFMPRERRNDTDDRARVVWAIALE